MKINEQYWTMEILLWYQEFEGIQINFEDRMCLIYFCFPGCGKPLWLDWEAKSGHPGWFETSH